MPLRDHKYDLDAMLGAIGPRTKLVYVCHPNNPTGTANGRDELRAFLDRVPEHVLVVLDQAYFEYIDDPDYADGIEEHFKRGGASPSCARSRRSTGSRDCGSATPCAGGRRRATSKVRRAFDVTATAQAAALASIGDETEIARRRPRTQTAARSSSELLRATGSSRQARRSATSSTSRSATGARSSSNCCARA